jgi:surfeit locus 1 family protein
VKIEQLRAGLFVPSSVALVGVVVLLGLGTWQLERRTWKEALIARLQERLSAPPVALPLPDEWPQMTPENSEFRRVAVEAEFLDRPHVYVFTSGSALRPDIKSPGYFVFAPARLQNGATVVVNTGYIRDYHRYSSIRGKLQIVGYLRWPETSNWFVSEHDSSQAIWFVRDHRPMAKLKQWGDLIAPFYIDQENPVAPSGAPQPAPLTVNLRNDHLQYAFTWYSLATAMIVIFSLWLYRRLRQGLG